MKLYHFTLVAFIFLFASCDGNHEYEITATDKYESNKASVATAEKQSPARFMTVTGNNKKNLFGQTVVKGALKNNAKMVTYKDIDIKLSFYSKTGTILEEDHEIIYEKLSPGENKNFKSKYFAPRGTDKVVMQVITAKY